MTKDQTTVKEDVRFAELAEAVNHFSIRLYRHLAEEEKKKDVIVSPYCVSAALAVTYLGARSKTAEQIKEAMNWCKISESLPQLFSETLDLLTEKQKYYNLQIANRILVANKFAVRNEYRDVTLQCFKAAVENVDFEDSCENIRKRINTWLENETNGVVKELLPPGVIGDFTKLFLVNSASFSGKWNYPFDKSNTQMDSFKTLDGQVVHVSMMNMQKLFPYFALADLKCRLVELPYFNRHLSMFIFLPVQTSCLPLLEAGLMDGQKLQTALHSVKPTLVHVSLPRFRMTSFYDLCSILSGLGITDAFKDGADLSGIAGTTGLHISQFVHQTVVEVNEEGNEENDASVRNCGPSPFRSKLVYFVVDHPFIFVIRDNRTGVVLFIGKVLRPSDS